MHPLRVLFLGTPDFAVPSLRAIARSHHPVVAVVTQPDRAKGRGHGVAEPAVKTAARELAVPVFQPESINSDESLARLREIAPDVIAVAAFGQKLCRAVLDLPRLGAFNLHASLLPRYRGAAPIAYAIWKGETQTGLTLFRMAEKMDAGDVALQVATPIGPEETAGELHDRLSELGAGLFVDFLDRLASENLIFKPQDASLATFAPSLKKEKGEVDWSKSAAEICRFVRAMTPWPSAYTFLEHPARGRERLTLLKVTALDEDQAEARTAGTVVEVTREHFTLAVGLGQVRVLRLQPAGKRAMDASEYLRGHQVSVSYRFVSCLRG